jgi:hypothetical protein
MSFAGEESRSIKDGIFAAIVTMCSKRILCRLRLRPKKRDSKAEAQRKKDSFKRGVQQAINHVSRASRSTRDVTDLSAMFTRRAKKVIKMLNAWTGHQVESRLGEIVEAVHELDQLEGLRSLVRGIPNDVLDPCSRHSLINIITKVARYKDVGRSLYRLAKRVPQVRNMVVVPVTLPKKTWKRESRIPSQPGLEETVLRTGTPKKYSLDLMCRYLDKDRAEAEADFDSQTQSTLVDGKLHAEIQILYYCEIHRSALPPRVICSSKDACFLCNTFIAAHGKLHTPRSHGRLYPGWRVPNLPAMGLVECRFNEMLEDQIKESLALLMLRQEKTRYDDPAESTLLTLIPSCSTLPLASQPGCGINSMRHTVVGDSGQSQPVRLLPTVPDPAVITLESSSSAGNDTQSREVALDTVEQGKAVAAIDEFEGAEAVVTAEDVEGAKTVAAVEKLATERNPSAFINGSRAHAEKTGSRPGTPDGTQPRIVKVGGLSIHICGPIFLNSCPERLSYQARRLLQHEVLELERQGADIVDVESLNGELVYELDEFSRLYLRHANTIVQVKISSATSTALE